MHLVDLLAEMPGSAAKQLEKPREILGEKIVTLAGYEGSLIIVQLPARPADLKMFPDHPGFEAWLEQGFAAAFESGDTLAAAQLCQMALDKGLA